MICTKTKLYNCMQFTGSNQSELTSEYPSIFTDYNSNDELMIAINENGDNIEMNAGDWIIWDGVTSSFEIITNSQYEIDYISLDDSVVDYISNNS